MKRLLYLLAAVLSLTLANVAYTQSMPAGQGSYRMNAASSSKKTPAPALAPAALAVAAVAAPAAPANTPMFAYKQALLTASSCGVIAPVFPAAITSDAIVAYSAAEGVLVKPMGAAALTPKDLAVNKAVCNVANAVLKADSDTLQAAKIAQQTEIQNASPDLISAVKTKTDAVVKAVASLYTIKTRIRCTIDNSDSKNPTYNWPTFAPLVGPGCTDNAILSFFAVNKSTELADNVKYLYNAQQSTSQVNADLLTATFSPGFQAVLAGTATAGSSQSTTTTTGSTTTTTSTDSVATAVAKIEAGGDFNLRFPVPFLYHLGSHGSIYGFTSPNLGFNINGFGAQSTITQSTEYSFNFPLEFYAQTKSIDPSSNGISSAVIFLDLKPGAEVVSSDLAQKIGLTSNRDFFLGQASAGIEFAESFRISFQYIYGPKQIYQTMNSGSSPTTTLTHIGGFHLAVSFSPQSSKTSKK